MEKNRLWRVDITHIRGYQAPSFYIETSMPEGTKPEKVELEALKLAKEKTRLSDFPHWEIGVVPTGRKKWDGKWLTLFEIEKIKKQSCKSC